QSPFTSSSVPSSRHCSTHRESPSMTGVRLSGRGSRVVRQDIARCLLVVAALLAAGDAGWQPAILGAAKQDTKTVDHFLAEDIEAPAEGEIPAIPDAEPPARPESKPLTKPQGKPAKKPEAKPRESAADPDKVPELEAPRVPRDIKDTAA